MTHQSQDTYINPVPEPKPAGFQRLAAVVLIVSGSAAVVVGLFMPWFSVGIGELDGSAAAVLDLSAGPQNSAWSSIGDVATVILIGAICAVVGAAFVVVGSLGSGKPRRDRNADVLLGGAALVVAFGLLLAWREWEDFSSTFLVFTMDAMPAVIDPVYGIGPWITIAGAVCMAAGLTLHLARQKSAVAAAAPDAISPLTTID